MTDNTMPETIWAGHYPDDGYTGESFDADTFDDGHNRTEYILKSTSDKRIAELERQNTDLQKSNTDLVLKNRELKVRPPSAADTEAGD